VITRRDIKEKRQRYANASNFQVKICLWLASVEPRTTNHEKKRAIIRSRFFANGFFD